ncbi:DUF1326 domain-containing protein [Kocuria sp.]|uniref:DUF1326 domain-containing protein n=1 Tax=Kocuria sp. TaxID=1871328 RepID=UPI0037BF155B
MDYTLTGEFLEACDCTVICPCWVDDDPTEGHCTGFVLWTSLAIRTNPIRSSMAHRSPGAG